MPPARWPVLSEPWMHKPTPPCAFTVVAPIRAWCLPRAQFIRQFRHHPCRLTEQSLSMSVHGARCCFVDTHLVLILPSPTSGTDPKSPALGVHCSNLKTGPSVHRPNRLDRAKNTAVTWQRTRCRLRLIPAVSSTPASHPLTHVRSVLSLPTILRFRLRQCFLVLILLLLPPQEPPFEAFHDGVYHVFPNPAPAGCPFDHKRILLWNRP